MNSPLFGIRAAEATRGRRAARIKYRTITSKQTTHFHRVIIESTAQKKLDNKPIIPVWTLRVVGVFRDRSLCYCWSNGAA